MKSILLSFTAVILCGQIIAQSQLLRSIENPKSATDWAKTVQFISGIEPGWIKSKNIMTGQTKTENAVVYNIEGTEPMAANVVSNNMIIQRMKIYDNFIVFKINWNSGNNDKFKFDYGTLCGYYPEGWQKHWDDCLMFSHQFSCNKVINGNDESEMIIGIPYSVEKNSDYFFYFEFPISSLPKDFSTLIISVNGKKGKWYKIGAQID